MSLQAVRPYISSRLTGLGYTEHVDPFNDENIPSSLINGAFHQLMLPISGVDRNNVSQGLDVPVQIKVLMSGYRSPEDALTQSIKDAEEIISDVTLLANYNQYSPPITGVFLDSLEFQPYSVESNDNVIQAVFVFRLKVYTCVE
mgnify:CR=1 FL=1